MIKIKDKNGFFPFCPCVFLSDTSSCGHCRIVLRQGGILQTSEDIFKTLIILPITRYRKCPVAQSV